MEHLRVGIVGAGYWGPNVIRTFSSLPHCRVAWVCDRRPGRLHYVAERFPGTPLTEQYTDLLVDPALDAVVVVTPVSTHRRLAEAALRAGKHVFVEKPLASTSADAAALVDQAERRGLMLATGHVYAYHPAVTALRAAVQAGELGRLCYAESSRVNLGPPDSEVDVVWDLAVHDISILLSLVESQPELVVAQGRNYLHAELTDVAFISLYFANGFLSQHHVSWLSPIRVRRFSLAGSRGSAIFDDTRTEGKLLLCGKGMDSRIGAKDTDTKDLFYSTGEVREPELPSEQPLSIECRHFLDCIRLGKRPLADGKAGLTVVRVLEAAALSIESGCRPVAFSKQAVVSPLRLAELAPRAGRASLAPFDVVESRTMGAKR